ncbi:phosphoinositide phosphatase sac4 [Phtheirospermum japonicum]|uniref:Phosphoinositide phosphatase sac4 n=1 Tax=Phtheirospermum japonicum TaxID=374723 RepID=A0A830D1T0_9LAMI|nr:phosphoinositide phosphatase sac4 [Phtheirospermum japonicum]
MADMLENVQPQQQGVLPGSPLSPPQEVFMQKFRLYETRSKFYMVGRDKSRTFWKILKIDRSELLELNIHEDPTTYTERECSDLLRRIHEGNKATGGLKFVTTCYGIVGFIKFLGPYYMLLITQRRQIGEICGHIIYSVSKSEIFPLTHSAVRSSMVDYRSENRYKKLLLMVDLTKDFYFSYSYNVMRSLQKNMCDKKPGLLLYETMFVWNEFLTRGIRNILQNTLWTVALVYGFFTQVRYLKRGVNEKGRVANDVETEQIVVEDVTEGVPMQISSVRDQTYEATRLHFEHLVKRYGNPIIILNLIKTNEKKPRESILRAEFANAIEVINKDLPEENRLKFLHWDLNKHSRSKATNVLLLLGKVAAYALTLTGFFYCQVTPALLSEGHLKLPSFENVATPATSALTYSDTDIAKHNYDEIEDSDESDRKSSGGNNTNPSVKPPTVQRGVLRTNCIDCLDRTNVAQYAYGWAALGHQLRALGVTTSTKIDLDDPLSEELMGFYERMGDTLAHQYGGSAAHNKIFSERRGQWKAAIQSQEFFRTLQRYYSNAYVDAEKQSAINIFLGHFQPQPGEPNVWELDSDQINFRRNGHSNMDENGRSLVKRSWSEGHILRESCSPTSDLNFSKGFPGANFSSESERGTKTHSESTPDMSTSEGELSYIRYTPPLPNRELFADMQRDRYIERENENTIDCSNFVDLDWLSSCGNSFEEELFERSMLTASPNATMLSENVLIGERTPSTSECESSTRGREQIGSDLYDSGAHNSDVFEEFSDSFVHWVTNGETLCHCGVKLCRS